MEENQGFIPGEKTKLTIKKKDQELCINCVNCVNVDKLGKNQQCENGNFNTKKVIISIYVPELFDCLEYEERQK